MVAFVLKKQSGEQKKLMDFIFFFFGLCVSVFRFIKIQKNEVHKSAFPHQMPESC